MGYEYLKTIKRYGWFELDNGAWAVMDRKTGELMAQTNGTKAQNPRTWAKHRCTQLNRREQCKDQ